MSIVDKLFGVKLHTSLKCEESGESIEVATNPCIASPPANDWFRPSAICCVGTVNCTVFSRLDQLLSAGISACTPRWHQ